jgi:hypothetical protein
MAAVIHEDGKPVRVFEGEGCITKAQKWAHHHYCLEEFKLKLWQLPDFLKVTFHLMTNKEFESLVGIHEPKEHD